MTAAVYAGCGRSLNKLRNVDTVFHFLMAELAFILVLFDTAMVVVGLRYDRFIHKFIQMGTAMRSSGIALVFLALLFYDEGMSRIAV